MKIALLALFFLLLTFTNAKLVYDIQGKLIPRGHLAYILTGSEIGRGYLTLKDAEKQSFVVESFLYPQPPLPARFLPKNSNDKYIRTDVAMNFTFPSRGSDQNSKWYVQRLPKLDYAVRFGDPEGIPHVKGNFKITNYGVGDYQYKIVFCPEESTQRTCGDLSSVQFMGDNFVVVQYVDDNPLVIQFENVPPRSASGISMAV